jgi:peptide/nickel transport system substrate-binding protein
MRRAVVIGLVCATLFGCIRAPVSVSTAGRHAWTIPHVLRVAEISDPDHLNPYLSEMAVTADLSSFVYSYLVTPDNRGRLVGDLASTVPSVANGGISRDGRTYVYHLRRNVIWQDGVPFTGRDVIASWQAVMNPRNNVFEREVYEPVTSIVAYGSTTIVVRLRKRYPPFVSRFFAQEGSKPVLAAHVLARSDFNTGELSRHPMGTGPFRFVSWVRGDRIVLVRFDRYFKGRPKLSRIEMRFIPNAATIAVELEKHQVDLIAAPASSLANQYRSIRGVIVETAWVNGQTQLLINVSKPGLQDIAVRRALTIAVPYESILHGVLHDVPVQPRNMLPVTALGYQPLPERSYDPAAAASLLERAGWLRGADGIRVRRGVRLAFTLVTVAGFTNFERVALLLQSSLKAIGIELAIRPYSFSVVYLPSGPIYGGSFDLALSGGNLDWDPDRYNSLACDRWYPRGENVDRFCDPRVDELERAGLQTDDPARRAVIYRRASRLLWTDVPYIPLYGGRRLTVRSSDLRNYRADSIAGFDANAWEWDI